MIEKKKVLALTQGKHVPSSRFRVLNVSGPLKKKGVCINLHDAYVSAYPPSGMMSRFLWLAQELVFRIPDIISSYRYDAVIFQRELVSTIPTYERLMKHPRILDVDDAIWLHRKGWAANSIAKQVDHIVCGNQYIADYFSRFDKPISIISTAVDVDRFRPRKNNKANKIIGWSGTSGGFKYLYGIENALSQVLEKFPEWTLRIVSDQRPQFTSIPDGRIEYIRWSEDCEVETIADMDIGLMPLDDTAWSRGKCSYKMLLYMACGLPVVVSDFGMNCEVLAHEFIGYGAIDEKQWYDSITKLIECPDLRARAGLNGRGVIVDNYSTEIAAEKWLVVISSVISNDSIN